jgi:hypothetical protein
MGEALRRDDRSHCAGRSAGAQLIAWLALLVALIVAPGFARAAQASEPTALQQGRFTIVAYPSEARLARSLLERAQQQDSFPGLPRPRQQVTIFLAPDATTFREWAGVNAPSWGAALAFPREGKVVMQGRRAGADAGDPVQTLRHELAHLALWEALGERIPRWFNEGYASWAAGEWGREEVLATSLALVVRGAPSVEELEGWFYHGPARARNAYALSHRAVAEMAALDPDRGLTLFLQYWREGGEIEPAMRRAFGMTMADFDRHWGRRTVFRYGALAVVGNLSLALGFMVILLMPLFVLRRRRDKNRMIALRAADAAAERRAALEGMLARGAALTDAEQPHQAASEATSPPAESPQGNRRDP